MFVIRTMLVAVLALQAASAPAAAQSAADIVDRMLDAYDERAAGIDDYTLVQEVMGFRTTLYFEKEVRDGRAVFALRGAGGGTGAVGEADDLVFTDLYAGGPELARHARYAGRERIDGAEVHVLAVDDMSALDLDFGGTAEEAGFVPRTGRLYVDGDGWLPVRMDFTGEVEGPEGPVEVRSRIELRDYRDVGGLLLPFRTVVRMEGLAETLDPEMRAQLEEMRRHLEELPPEQRAMVEEMMRGQLEQVESMLGADGDMTVEMVVVDVRVNEGPPA